MEQSTLDMLEIPASWIGSFAAIAQARSSTALHEACATAVRHILPASSDGRLHWPGLEGSNSSTPDRDLDTALREQLHWGQIYEDPVSQLAYVPMLHEEKLRGWLCFTCCTLSIQQRQALLALAAIVIPVAELISRHHQNQEQLRRRNFRQQFGRLRDRLLLDDLVPHIGNLATSLIPASQVVIALIDDIDEQLTIAFADAAIDHARLDLEQALLSSVLQQRAPLLTDNIRVECHTRQIEIPGGVDLPPVWLGMPLIVHERPIGAFAVSPATDYHFSDGDLQLLGELTNHAGAALHNARLFSRVEQQARQLRLLNEINRSITSELDADEVPRLIMQQVQELLNVEEGSLLLLDPECGDLIFGYASGPTGLKLIGTRLPPGTGIAGAVAISGQPSIVNDTRDDQRFYAGTDADTGFFTRALLAVPLRSVSGVIGVIEVMNRRDNTPFTRADLQLLEAVADQAVIALENSQRFAQIDKALTRRLQELDRSNTRLHELLRVGNALRAELQMDELLRLISEAARTGTGFRNAVIALLRRDQRGVPYLQRVMAAGPAANQTPTLQRVQVPLASFESLLRPEFRHGESTYVFSRRPAVYQELWNSVQQPVNGNSATAADQQAAQYVLFSLMRDRRNEVLGLISVDDPEEGLPPDREQIQVLEIFANQAAVAIENARLYSEQQRNLQSMMALNGLGLAIHSNQRSPHEILELTSRGMAETSTARCVLTYQLQEDNPGRLTSVYRYGQPGSVDETRARQLAEEVMEAGRPRQIVESGGTAWLALPLRATRRVLGAICIAYDEQLPRQADQETLTLFASQAAMAIESLQLFSTLRQGRDQLASIMASTQEGMVLINAMGRIVVTNSAARRLTGLESMALQMPTSTAANFSIELTAFLNAWRSMARYPVEEWQQLNEALDMVARGIRRNSHGELNTSSGELPALAWSLLPVAGMPTAFAASDAHEPQRAMLLVLRDVTAAKENERLRQDLTDMIVHDLRNPLSSLSTSIEMLMRGVGGDINRVQHDILTVAMRGITEMLDMIALLLDISRLEGGGMPINREPHLPDRIVRQSIARQEPLAREKQVNFRLDIANELPSVYVDQELIKRVLQNLIDNALKASKPGKTITVSIRPPAADSPPDTHTIGEGDACFFLVYPRRLVTITVTDEGEGIAPQDREKIFTKFGQAGNRRRKGTGLGLTFCKLVVEAHGGNIWVDSTPGEGSSFSLTLPTVDVIAED